MPSSESEKLFRTGKFSRGTLRPIYLSGKVFRKTSQDQSTFIIYTRVREIILATLKAIGLKHRLYGTHIMREGGASLAANMAIPDRLFKRH